jgi:hypothetical protein
MSEIYIVKENGEERYVGNEDSCWLYILNHQGQSVHHAITHEGWSIEKKATESD